MPSHPGELGTSNRIQLNTHFTLFCDYWEKITRIIQIFQIMKWAQFSFIRYLILAWINHRSTELTQKGHTNLDIKDVMIFLIFTGIIRWLTFHRN